jgi:hypothetical protein
MKNIFGVLSDAFMNSGQALLGLIPLLKTMVKKEKINRYREIYQDVKVNNLFSEQTLEDLIECFNQFINNTYQISSLIV